MPMTQEMTVLCPRCHKPNSSQAHYCIYCGMNIVLNDDMPSDDRRYFMTRVIKQGGQGSVFEGVDTEGRVYAIKEMLDNFIDPQEREEAQRRFNAEAELLTRLQHPRIPKIYSHFTDEGRHYLTMDLVQGKDLEHILEEAGVIPEEQVLEWALQICDVLNYLHGQGLIYRDMKPSNIMVEPDGNIKVVDFGIAKVFKPTERGTQIGTPGYAPPEQYQGLATPRSDIYALAATLHHLLTGRDPTQQPPFSFPSARDVNINVSRRTSDALDQALKMQPEERIASISEFRALLRPTGGLPALQARVAAPSGSLQPATAAAQRSTASTAQPAPVPPPAVPPPVPAAAPPPAAPPPPAPFQVPQPQPQPQHQSGCTGSAFNWLLTLLALVLVWIPIIYFLFPGALPDGISQFIEQLLPTRAQPTTPALSPARNLTLEVEVLVPASSDDAAIREALRDGYRALLAQQHPGAIINPNVPVSLVGSWEQVGQQNGQLRYRARMQGFVSLPQGP